MAERNLKLTVDLDSRSAQQKIQQLQSQAESKAGQSLQQQFRQFKIGYFLNQLGAGLENTTGNLKIFGSALKDVQAAVNGYIALGPAGAVLATTFSVLNGILNDLNKEYQHYIDLQHKHMLVQYDALNKLNDFFAANANSALNATLEQIKATKSPAQARAALSKEQTVEANNIKLLRGLLNAKEQGADVNINQVNDFIADVKLSRTLQATYQEIIDAEDKRVKDLAKAIKAEEDYRHNLERQSYTYEQLNAELAEYQSKLNKARTGEEYNYAAKQLHEIESLIAKKNQQKDQQERDVKSLATQLLNSAMTAFDNSRLTSLRNMGVSMGEGAVDISNQIENNVNSIHNDVENIRDILRQLINSNGITYFNI